MVLVVAEEGRRRRGGTIAVGMTGGMTGGTAGGTTGGTMAGETNAIAIAAGTGTGGQDHDDVCRTFCNIYTLSMSSLFVGGDV